MEKGAENEDRLTEVDMEEGEGRAFRQYVRPPARAITPPEVLLGQVDIGGGEGHSSEEELEEINTRKESTVFKRKWTGEHSESSNSESEEELEQIVGQGAGESPGSATSTSSKDTEEEGDTEEGPRSNTSPLQFITSPPGGVHKPRRCLSPVGVPVLRSAGPTPVPVFRSQQETAPNLSTSLGDLSSIDMEGGSYLGPGHHRKSISARKRSRTSRVQKIQRPCLDFEKMQQLWAVSWRTGGELSLFCW